MKEITLEYLRGMIEEEKETYRFLLAKISEEGDTDPVNEFDISRLTLGKIIAYQELIKTMRGLSEREFSMEIKKGTL